jgi:hypothetical protein
MLNVAATDADAHFEVVRLLGRGGFGAVEQVTSNLSFEGYAVSRLLLHSKLC